MRNDDSVREYLPLVKSVAGRVALGMHSQVVDYDDLVQYGMCGLLDAMSRFDPTRHVQFNTYATYRIRGAMFDGMRAVDWAPKSLRMRAREAESADADLAADLGRPAAAAEIAAALGVTEQELRRLRARIDGAEVLSMHAEHGGEDGDGASIEDGLAASEASDPAALAERAEVRRVIAAAIEDLPENERQALTLHYYEELPLQEIAQVLAVTPSRVSQLHRKARLTLRAKLGSAGIC